MSTKSTPSKSPSKSRETQGRPIKDLRVNMTPERLAKVILRAKPRKAKSL